MLRYPKIIVLLILQLLIVSRTWAERRDQVEFRDDAIGIRFVVPRGWFVSTQSGFPSIIANILHKKDAGHISVSIDRNKNELDPKNLFKQTVDVISSTGTEIKTTEQRKIRRFNCWVLRSYPIHAVKESNNSEVIQYFLYLPKRPPNAAEQSSGESDNAINESVLSETKNDGFMLIFSSAVESNKTEKTEQVITRIIERLQLIR